MRRALELAQKGEGYVLPNPMVGAVLVKNGKIIAEGYHQYFGGPHAEVKVLDKLTKSQIRGSTLYVTLEPCCHTDKKTPPCTKFLISKGIKSLVIAMRDPNPLVSGNGIRDLKSHGVKILTKVLEHDAMKLNEIFIKNMTSQLPFVSIKLGVTLDGKIALSAGSMNYLTNKKSLKHVHHIRSKVDAILTSSETVIRDNPHLGIRLTKGKDPIRIIVDSHLRTNLKMKVYRDQNAVLAVCDMSSESKRKSFLKKGYKVFVYKGLRVPLKSLLQDIYKMGICNIMIEAGGKMVTSLLHQRLADKLTLIYAPLLIGDEGIPFVRDLGIKRIEQAIKISEITFQNLDDNMMVSGKIIYP